MTDDRTPLPGWALDPVPADAMVDWVKALRDENAIHVDPQAAERLGFGHRTVNPGPTNLAYVLNMLMGALPDRYPTRISARFLGNVFSDDAVEVAGEAGADGTCTARLCDANSGEVVLDAVVTLQPREALA